MDYPRVSVIVTAHNRPEYLIEALTSLKKQTAPYDSFEVIVVKDYQMDLKTIDIGKMDVRFIDLTETDLVSKHVAGIRNSRGDYIALMDDDDLFASIKIECILRASSNMTGMSFYFNEKNFFNERLESMEELTAVRDSGTESFTRDNFTSRRLNRNTPWYNLSSMVIGRKLAILGTEIIGEFRREIDPLWYLIALENADLILHDRSHLTFYRRHTGGVSRSDNREKICRYAKQALESYDKMAGLFIEKATIERLILMRSEWEAKSRILGCLVSNGNFFSLVFKFLRSLGSNSPKDPTKLIILLFVSCMSVEVASQIYPRFYM